jgi:N-acetylglucosamine repressor
MEKSLKLSNTASSKLQFRINNSIIFNYVRENKSITRIKISKDLNISPSAVSRMIDDLIKKEYIIEVEKLKTSRGKRPILLKVNKDKGFVVAVDLGKEKIKIAFYNFCGEMIYKYDGFKISYSKNISNKVVNEIQFFLNKCYQDKKLKADKIKAICIGIPAQIDLNTGKVLSVPLYKNWRNLNLKEVLEKEFNIPVYIENGANLSALGIKYYGEGINFKDFILVDISNGIGAGIINDGHLFRGALGFAGEIGFTLIGPENFRFKIEDKGYLEKFASVLSLKEKILKEILSGEKTIVVNMVNGNLKKIEPDVVCKAAIDGDKLANNIITESVNFLSIAIINLILIQNPQLIAIGGSICNLPYVDELFLEPIIKKVKSSIPFKMPEIKLSLLGKDAVLVGAAYMAIESIISNEFPYEIDKN